VSVDEAIPVVLVDDDQALRRAVRRQLERCGHEVQEAGSVAEARTLLEGLAGALVLCDIDMPGESGLVLVQALRDRQPEVAVVMVTAVDEPAVAAAADFGAYGYVVKPFEANELTISVQNALRRRELEIAHRRTEADLAATIDCRTAELRDTLEQVRGAYEDTVRRLAWAAEYRDPETGNHLERMSRYTAVLARSIGMAPEQVELLRLAAPMHDIGKVGIPDAILCKPGRYDDADRAAMAQHPEIGHRILAGSDSELLQVAAVVALAHHERWDGTGYPSGLAGTAIPLEGRIVAIADVFDALCSQRRYKDAFPLEAALAILVDGAGSHFDPKLVDAFLAARDEVEAIHDAWADADLLEIG
jgi:putative two-component system response regulator